MVHRSSESRLSTIVKAPSELRVSPSVAQPVRRLSRYSIVGADMLSHIFLSCYQVVRRKQISEPYVQVGTALRANWRADGHETFSET